MWQISTALNMGICVACGLANFLGHQISRPGTVLFLNNELSFPDHLDRFKKCVSVLSQEDVKKLERFICPDSFPPFPKYYHELESKIVETKPVLVILDCLYRSHDKKENDSSEMKTLMRQFDQLRKKHSVAIVVVHHTKKGSRMGKMHNDDMRGSGVFGGVADQVIQIRRSAIDDSSRLLKSTKSRHSAEHLRRAHLLSLNESTLWFIDEGEVNEEEHLPTFPVPQRSEPRIDFRKVYGDKQALSRGKIVESCKELGVGVTDRTIDRHLRKAVSKGELSRDVEYGKYVLKTDKIKTDGEVVEVQSASSPIEALPRPA